MPIENQQVPRREHILNAAIRVFGRYGYKKTSVDELAGAAGISKPGLYLHFSSKDEVFKAALAKYLDDGLAQVQDELARPNISLFNRVLHAMDAWFGRHFDTFAPESFDVIEAGNQLSRERTEEYKAAFQGRLAKALSESIEFKRSKNTCSPKEVAQALFICGLSWKEGHASRKDFVKKMETCIRVCCQVRD